MGIPQWIYTAIIFGILVWVFESKIQELKRWVEKIVASAKPHPQTSTLNLSTVERMLLENQYKILEALNPDNAKEYIKRQTILQRGYAFFYEDAVDGFDELSLNESHHVFAVLDIYRILEFSYHKLSDKSGINPILLKFPGFDRDEEWKYWHFSEFLKEIGRWQELPAPSNSHLPSKRNYGAMLERYHKVKAKHAPIGWDHILTKSEIIEILG